MSLYYLGKHEPQKLSFEFRCIPCLENVLYRMVKPVLLLFQLLLVGSSCESGWTDYNDNCYKYVNNPIKQWEAQSLCQNDDADLVSISNIDEMNFIRQEMMLVMAWHCFAKLTDVAICLFVAIIEIVCRGRPESHSPSSSLPSRFFHLSPSPSLPFPSLPILSSNNLN